MFFLHPLSYPPIYSVGFHRFHRYYGGSDFCSAAFTPHCLSRSPCFSPFTFQPFRLQPPYVTLGPFSAPWTGSRDSPPRSPVLHEARGAVFKGAFRLRHSLAGSSCTYSRIEFVKSYGLVFHLLLLSTPPRGDAVTIGYWFNGLPRRGLAPLWRTAFAGALAWASNPLPHFCSNFSR